MKLDRFLAKYQAMGRKRARLCVMARRVMVDGVLVERHDREVNRFCRVELDGVGVGEVRRRIGVMLYKPVGVVSATKDAQWQTVVELVEDPDRDQLHLVGRLDRGTSGLVLLTNDGHWSKALMHPEHQVPKVYEVTTERPIAADAVAAFQRGFYFHTEDITTLPAQLEIVAERKARLTLHEGRYHQVKRMFHRVDNRVTGLHRISIGNLALPGDWQPGQWRHLEAAEMDGITLAPAAPHRPAPPDRRCP